MTVRWFHVLFFAIALVVAAWVYDSVRQRSLFEILFGPGPDISFDNNVMGMFDDFIGAKHRGSVTELRGYGHGNMQSWDTTLKFKVNDESEFDRILADGYTRAQPPIDMDADPAYIPKYLGTWDPLNIQGAECYQRHYERGGSSGRQGTFRIVFDRRNLTVYFCGEYG